jgi:peptide/nickel transport system permease protein
MVRLLVRQALRFALGLIGAVVLAAALSALAAEGAEHSAQAWFQAFLARLVAMARLDFGMSHVSGWSAAGEVAQAMPYTATLVTLGALVALVIGIPLGLLLGTGPLRRALAPLIQIVAAAPVFCAALALSWISIHLFASKPVAPSGSLFDGDAVHVLNTLLLPVLTVGAAGAAAVQLALRRAASQAQKQPWRTSLRLMGLPAFEIDRIYVAPEVMAGVLASLGEMTLALFSAAAVAEWVFGWPGAAVLFVKSLAFGDWNVVALVLLVFAAVKFIADLIGSVAAEVITGEEVRA